VGDAQREHEHDVALSGVAAHRAGHEEAARVCRFSFARGARRGRCARIVPGRAAGRREVAGTQYDSGGRASGPRDRAADCYKTLARGSGCDAVHQFLQT
jgi:hypothetical protein